MALTIAHAAMNQLIEYYITCRESERGLTPKGKRWIMQTLPRFDRYVQAKGVSILDVKRDVVRNYLSSIRGQWNKHSNFRAVRAFYNWLEREGYIPLSPCHGLQAPKLPKKIMPRPHLQDFAKLLAGTKLARDKALICLFMDTGFRLSEVSNMQFGDIDWEKQTVKVWGKGGKQRMGKFSDVTAGYWREHLSTCSPNGNVWGITEHGIASMLKRLHKRTNIVCNPHSFRRAWAVESIRRGTNLLDVQVLGGWESLEMVKRYANEINSEDAVSRYDPLTGHIQRQENI